MPPATIFRHARWRLVILGLGGLALAPLMLWQAAEMLDPAWHTEASRGAWFNHLPPLLRFSFMLGAGGLLAAIGTANLLVVLLRSPALILDREGVTFVRVLQSRVRVPWRDIARLSEGKGSLRLERADQAPLVIGYDWLDAAPREIRAAVEASWRARKPV